MKRNPVDSCNPWSCACEGHSSNIIARIAQRFVQILLLSRLTHIAHSFADQYVLPQVVSLFHIDDSALEIGIFTLKGFNAEVLRDLLLYHEGFALPVQWPFVFRYLVDSERPFVRIKIDLHPSILYFDLLRLRGGRTEYAALRFFIYRRLWCCNDFNINARVQ